jgi:hypothetical protein
MPWVVAEPATSRLALTVNGTPAKWPERLAPCSPAVHLSGGLARAASEQLGDRVEVWVGRGDAVEVGLNDLGGRHLATRNAAGEAGRGHRPQAHVHTCILIHYRMRMQWGTLL